MNDGDFGGVGHTTHRACAGRSSGVPESKSVFEVMQIDRDAGEVLLEAMIDPPKKRLKTALWVKADDPRFIFEREV